MKKKHEPAEQAPKARTAKRRRRAAIRQFVPKRGLQLVIRGRTETIKPVDVSPDLVGWKAFGLTSLPPEWVPSFFVINTESASSPSSCQPYADECISALGIERSQVIVRSSGTSETIEHRGSLPSETCPAHQTCRMAHKLSETVPEKDRQTVHWIAQLHIQPRRKGHLSNERRLCHEPRDFIAEIEPAGDLPGYAAPIGVRHWRDGDDVADLTLACASEPVLTLVLRKVALWAAGLPHRILLEWVWDGSRVWVVQADIAKSPRGVRPDGLRPKEVSNTIPSALALFRKATKRDFKRYGKLRNTRRYSDVGYEMPPFYVMDDAATMQEVLGGEISDALERELGELIHRPLVIRTDGENIPAEKREMLPRSESLETPEQVKKWLIDGFAKGCKSAGIAECKLALIAHHFIPSVAAAWARSEPSSTTVRIESLWGLPEGLYWHSHDTFEVDASNNRPMRKRLRFKGTFVAPDRDGRWVHHRPSSPFDWGPSVRKTEWLLEIAQTTKKIADREGKAISIMWFVDNDPRGTRHAVLPWFHMESTIGSPKAAPRFKRTTATSAKIETTAEWEDLKEQKRAGKHIERIMLEPKDPELVRNPEFAKELGKFAASSNIVIELSGGILSHAYHILQRQGAQVECVDLFGADEEEVEFNKLVRDKVPELIHGRGESSDVVHLKGEALLTALRYKLVEEAYEALDAKGAEAIIAELADMQEVISAIREALQIPVTFLDDEREKKRRRRGGFRRGLMLRKTVTPHSLSKNAPVVSNRHLPHVQPPKIITIDRADQIPIGKLYRRPDTRKEADATEALLTFEIDLSYLGDTKQTSLFELPVSKNDTRSITASVQLKRDRSSLWAQLRVKLEPSQMSFADDQQMTLKFPED